MCIYTVKKQQQKNSSKATPPKVPKLGVSGVKDHVIIIFKNTLKILKILFFK